MTFGENRFTFVIFFFSWGVSGSDTDKGFTKEFNVRANKKDKYQVH